MKFLSRVLLVTLPLTTVALVFLTLQVFKTGDLILPSQVAKAKQQSSEKSNSLEALTSEKTELSNSLQKQLETLNSYKAASEEVENSDYKMKLAQQYASAKTLDVLEAKAIILNSLGYIPEDTYKDTSYQEFGMYVATLTVGALASKISSPAASKVISHLVLDSHSNMMEDGITLDSVTKDTVAGINGEAKAFIRKKTKGAMDYYKILTEDDETNTTDYLQHVVNSEALETLEELQEYLEKEIFDEEDFANMCETYNKYMSQLEVLDNANPFDTYKLNSLYKDYITNSNNLKLLGVQ